MKTSTLYRILSIIKDCQMIKSYFCIFISIFALSITNVIKAQDQTLIIYSLPIDVEKGISSDIRSINKKENRLYKKQKSYIKRPIYIVFRMVNRNTYKINIGTQPDIYKKIVIKSNRFVYVRHKLYPVMFCYDQLAANSGHIGSFGIRQYTTDRHVISSTGSKKFYIIHIQN